MLNVSKLLYHAMIYTYTPTTHLKTKVYQTRTFSASMTIAIYVPGAPFNSILRIILESFLDHIDFQKEKMFYE